MATERRRVQINAKPAVLIALIAVAVALDPFDRGVWAWFVVALVFSLIGDALLLVPDRLFIAGLASFAVAHLAYVVGFLVAGVDGTRLLAGIVVAGLASAAIGPWIVGAVVRRRRDTVLAVAVGCYIVIIAAMVSTAVGASTRSGALGMAAVVGALLFWTSDACIGCSRFVVADSVRWRTAVHVTYHLGQIGLVTWLASGA